MLQAMGTGVEGSMTTVHANSPADAFSRMETMVMMAKLDLPSRFIRQQMASVVHMIVQTARMSDGTRKVTHIAEVTGLEELNIKVRDIFAFEQTGVSDDGRVIGEFRGSLPSPEFMERLRLSGTPVATDLFEGVVSIQ